ncbi:unnamed protein product, partial [marine sediment metagenome]
DRRLASGLPLLMETERRGDVRASSEPSTLGLLKGGRYHSGVNE